MFKGLYDWTIRLAESPRAPRALAVVSFAESSFFPVPPDVMLVPMVMAKPERAWTYALICTIASVLGGLAGYAIGALLYDTLGAWLIGLYGYGDKMDAFRALYQQYATGSS
jgi:membrane protein YqaA with SNARE-associated domain